MSKQKTPTRRNIAQHEFELLPHHIEHPEGESMTVPDESMTIREIMRKHVSGMRVKEALFREGFYEDTEDFDSPDFSEISRLDFTEKDELRESNKQKLEHLTKQQQQQQQKQKAAEAAKEEPAKKASQKPETPSDEARTKDEAKSGSGSGEIDA